MKKLAFSYQMTLAFSAPASAHHFTLRVLPRSSGTQEVLRLEYAVTPSDYLAEGTDSFGSRLLYGCAAAPHDSFSVSVQGVAMTGLDAAGEETPEKVAPYRYPTPLTAAGARLHALYEKLADACPVEGTAARAEYFLHALHERFSYQKNLTHVETTAEEALAAGGGVCQDYAQILLALLRLEKIPCRYVTGLLLGEGESHAWAEVYADGRWRGLDPTNDTLVRENHIRIACGRDYRDCRMSQGVFTGGGTQTQNILVEVSEV